MDVQKKIKHMDSFEAKVSKTGRRRVVNIPNKNKEFQPGDNVKVKKAKK